MNYQQQLDWALACFKAIEAEMEKCIAENYSEESIKAVKAHIKGVYISSGWQQIETTLQPTEFLLEIVKLNEFAGQIRPGLRIEGNCNRGVLGDEPRLVFTPVIETPEDEYYSHGYGDDSSVELTSSQTLKLSQIARLFGFDEIRWADPIDPKQPEKLKKRGLTRSSAENSNQEPDWPWPIPDITSSRGKSTFAATFADASALKILGYSVGVNGLQETERKELLERFFTGPLPSIVNELFGDAWGNPGSEERLKKMADTISSNCKNFKRNDASRYRVAIEDWESDLSWLRENFYKRGRFPWPDTVAE